jgi:hypothetical protein
MARARLRSYGAATVLHWRHKLPAVVAVALALAAVFGKADAFLGFFW